MGILLAKCIKCSNEFKIRSCGKVDLTKKDGTKRTTYQTNLAAVMDQMSTGGGCSSLEECLSIMGVPSLSKSTFTDIERCLGSSFVIVDGGWSKRAHGHSYNANSGVGAIFGATTKKLLYMRVRNKYCAVCSIAKKKHWSRSSTSMGANIIAAGFKHQSQCMVFVTLR